MWKQKRDEWNAPAQLKPMSARRRLIRTVSVTALTSLVLAAAISIFVNQIISVRASGSSSSAPVSIPGSAGQELQALVPERGPTQLVRFVLFDAGIFPEEVHARSGLVIVSIEDETRISSGLAIVQDTSSASIQIGVVQRVQNHWRGRSQLRLGPGRYRVFDTSRTTNEAVLIVQ